MDPFEIIHSCRDMRRYDSVVCCQYTLMTNAIQNGTESVGICDKRFPLTLWNITYLYLFMWTNCYRMWKTFSFLPKKKSERAIRKHYLTRDWWGTLFTFLTIFLFQMSFPGTSIKYSSWFRVFIILLRIKHFLCALNRILQMKWII